MPLEALASWLPLRVSELLFGGLGSAEAVRRATKYVVTKMKNPKTVVMNTAVLTDDSAVTVKTAVTATMPIDLSANNHAETHTVVNDQHVESELLDINNNLVSVKLLAKQHVKENSLEDNLTEQLDFIRLLDNTIRINYQHIDSGEYGWDVYFKEYQHAQNVAETGIKLKSKMPAQWADDLRPYMRNIGVKYEKYLEVRKKLLMNSIDESIKK